jgi:hypothetical protein
VTTNHVPYQRAETDTPATITDLIRRLTDDSKRLAVDEIRLAKLEMADRIRVSGRGTMYLGVAFGAGVIALSALTICVIAALAMAVGTVWIAALVAGAVELAVGVALVHRGLHAFGRVPDPASPTAVSRRAGASMVASRAD